MATTHDVQFFTLAVTQNIANGTVLLLPADPYRTLARIVTSGVVAFGHDATEIAGGAGGVVLTAGLVTDLHTTDQISALVFADNTTMRIYVERTFR